MRAALLAFALVLAGLAACNAEVVRSDDWNPTAVAGGAAGTQGSSGASGTPAPSGMPCDISKMLSGKCTSCHQPGGASSLSLLSREDLMAKAKSDPSQTNAQVSVKRMADQARPMPPGGAAPPADVALLQKWIADGYPAGSCATASDAGAADGGDAGTITNPYATPDQCTSGRTNQESQGIDMQPGRACGVCHGAGVLAGTVYPTAHEPNNCVGVNGSATTAQIFIIGADSKSYGPFGLSATGNFKVDKGTIPMPYTAKIVSGTGATAKERVMVTKTSNGDCNLCHTLRGSQGAPGRIMLP
jgi:hypothetical protein